MNEQNTSPVQSPAPTQQKPRRVGRFAFALLLIAAGILLAIYQLNPNFDLLTIVKFSPLLLVVLGVELLYYSAKPNANVKFDWLAMLGSAFILCIVGVAALLPTFVSQWGPGRSHAASRIEAQTLDELYNALSATPDLKAKTNYCNVNVWFNHDTSGTYTLESGDDCVLNAGLRGPYADAESFAADCMAIMQVAADNDLGFTRYSFKADEDSVDGVGYYLDCVAAYPAGLTAAQVAQRVQTSYHYDGSSFSTEAERDQYIKENLKDKIADEYSAAHDGALPDDDYLNAEAERRLAAAVATPETAAQ